MDKVQKPSNSEQKISSKSSHNSSVTLFQELHFSYTYPLQNNFIEQQYTVRIAFSTSGSNVQRMSLSHFQIICHIHNNALYYMKSFFLGHFYLRNKSGENRWGTLEDVGFLKSNCLPITLKSKCCVIWCRHDGDTIFLAIFFAQYTSHISKFTDNMLKWLSGPLEWTHNEWYHIIKRKTIMSSPSIHKSWHTAQWLRALPYKWLSFCCNTTSVNSRLISGEKWKKKCTHGEVQMTNKRFTTFRWLLQ
jgi:hypothetical protein